MAQRNGTCDMVIFEKDTLSGLLTDMALWIKDNTSARIWEVLVSVEDRDRDLDSPVYGWIYHSGSWNIK